MQGVHTELQELGGDRHSENWLPRFLQDSRTGNNPQTRVVKSQPLAPSQNDVVKSKVNSGCKLFGFHLNSKPVTSVSTTLTNGDTEKPNQVCQQAPKDVQNKLQVFDIWYIAEVHKQGIALGRSVDLSKYSGYDELIAELDQIFDFDGALLTLNKNWLVVYTDNEGDMMLVGDDPWK
ncbi:hypothetical protein BHE74_00032532 [Ensete ventricosum]|nr:hypothetical protein GW17_00027331 [Ensete ventricosum]RWW60473.1 hypothetical protein BHE74_00032532 [Ensete ventricosum]RZS07538.1 hypothetical protein BHM03_00038394 [Ensete ventricosum]